MAQFDGDEIAMQRRHFITLLAAGAVALPGCAKPSNTQPVVSTETDITIGTESAVLVGLTALSVANPGLARIVATALSAVANGAALPYLHGTEGAVGAVSSAAINSALAAQCVSLPAEAQVLVTIAAGVLDEYLPIPGAATYLSPAHVAYLEDFFKGISNGCADFSGGRYAAESHAQRTVGGHWLNLKALAAKP